MMRPGGVIREVLPHAEEVMKSPSPAKCVRENNCARQVDFVVGRLTKLIRYTATT